MDWKNHRKFYAQYTDKYIRCDHEDYIGFCQSLAEHFPEIDALVRAAERAYEEADRDFIPSMVSLKEALKAIGIKNE